MIKPSKSSQRLALLAALLISSACKPSTKTEIVYVPTPSDNTCSISEAPPELVISKPEDLAGPGEFGCPETFETCMVRDVSLWVLRLQQWSDEQYSKCKPKAAPAPVVK